MGAALLPSFSENSYHLPPCVFFESNGVEHSAILGRTLWSRRGKCVSTIENCGADCAVDAAARVGAWRAGDLLDRGLRCEDARVWRGSADKQFGGGIERAVGAGGSGSGGFAIRDESALWAARVGVAGARDCASGSVEEDFGGGWKF